MTGRSFRVFAQHRCAVMFVVSAGFLSSCGTHPRLSAEPASRSPLEPIEVTVLLLGDAGASSPDGDPVLSAVAREASRRPHTTTILFLGDNIYPDGMPEVQDPQRARSEQRLSAQLDVVAESGARGIFVPGNHDWGKGGGEGWLRVLRQQNFIAARNLPMVSFLPSGGCPGPTAIDLSSRVRVVALDTQWWLDDDLPFVVPDSACPIKTTAAVLDSLGKLLAVGDGRDVMVMAHHPIESEGPRGGYFGLKDHLFPLRRVQSWLWVPLPIIGSIYPLVRKSGLRTQDLSSSRYRTMRRDLDSLFTVHRPFAMATGHEHNLQVMRHSGAGYIFVSGAGMYDHSNPVRWSENTLFASAKSGYMVLDFLSDGRKRLAVVIVNENGAAHEAYSAWLERD